ncbi:MAG TPA: S26 family signal peptidase, partial [Natrialbaceae archaeon]|nr:S26 family signal peptidase [Natrialbaceae archaeon]
FYVAIFAAILVLAATAAMVLPAGTQKYGIVSAEFESERADVIPMGESKNWNYTLTNGGLVPTHVYLEPASEGVETEPNHVYLSGRSSVNATLTVHAPPQTGYYRRFVTEHRYLALLPAPAIQYLYGVHPWAPIVAIDALIGIPFYLVGVALAGGGRLRDRSRDRDRSLTARLRRAVMGR